MVRREGSQLCPLLPDPELHHPVQPAHSYSPPRHTEGQGTDRGSWGPQFLRGEVETGTSGPCSQPKPRVTQDAGVRHFPPSTPTLPRFLPQGQPAPLTLVTLSPSTWKKLKVPAQLPTAITCPSGWKAMQLRGLGQVCWEASCPRTVSHSWRREKGRRTQGAEHRRLSCSVPELQGPPCPIPCPQQARQPEPLPR